MKGVIGLCIVVSLLLGFAHYAFALSTSQTATLKPDRSSKKGDSTNTETETARDDVTTTSSRLREGSEDTSTSENDAIDPDLPLLLVDVSTDRSQAFVHEQILVTVQVGAPASAFAITGGLFQVPGSKIKTLNVSDYFNKSIDQTDYRFKRIVYALFAENPGELVLPSISYSATLPVSAVTDTTHSEPNRTKKRKKNPRLRSSSKPLTLRISQAPLTQAVSNKESQQAKASSNNSNNSNNSSNSNTAIWLPAIDVKLSSSWTGTSKPNDNTEQRTIIPAGTPVKRHVLIEIQGQHIERVPLYEQRVNEPQRQYADQAELEQILTAASLNGTKRLSSTIIAPEAGQFLLPALTIDWWDINEKTWRTSELQPEAIEVVTAGVAQSNSQGAATQPALPDQTQRLLDRIQSTPPATLYILGLLVIALAILCTRLWQRQVRLSHNVNNTAFLQQKAPATEAEAWRILRKRINKKELPGIRQALLHWIAKHCPDEYFQREEQIKARWPELDEPLSKLDELLYSANLDAQPGKAFRSEANKQLKVLRKALIDMRKYSSSGSDVNGLETQNGKLEPLYRCD